MAIGSVLVDLEVRYINVIKFVAIEILISLLLEPAWELFVACSAYKRVARGERVPLRTFWKWRSWPCQVVLGSFSKAAAIVLSLSTITAAFLAEFSVDSVPYVLKSEEAIRIYSLGAGGTSADDYESAANMTREILPVVTKMADSCVFRNETGNYVYSTFVDDGSCVEDTGSDENQPDRISDVCVMTKETGHNFVCRYHYGNGSFSVTPGWDVDARVVTSRHVDFSAAFGESVHPIIFNCGEDGAISEGSGTCKHHLTGSGEAKLFLLRDSSPLASKGDAAGLLVTDEWRMITYFGLGTGGRISTRVGDIPMFVYRKVNGNEKTAFHQNSKYTSFWLRLVHIFADSFETKPTYATESLDRKREGIILMLALEGFGRSGDIDDIRDFRKDTNTVKTEINLALLSPFLLLSFCGFALLFWSLALKKKQSLFRVPVNLHEMIRSARGRELGTEYFAHGFPDDGLMLGIVENRLDSRGGQIVSFSAVESDPWGDHQIPQTSREETTSSQCLE